MSCLNMFLPRDAEYQECVPNKKHICTHIYMHRYIPIIKRSYDTMKQNPPKKIKASKSYFWNGTLDVPHLSWFLKVN